jgi:2',3'-cyclic-nucleotide 2'-phosphodiesterase (5'-nucleotidase family)
VKVAKAKTSRKTTEAAEAKPERTTAYNKIEMLQVADAVAREKSIEREEVLEAMEQAIQKAGRAKYGHEHDIRSQIDRTTGDFVPGSIVANNEIVTQDVPKAKEITRLIAKYNVFAGPIAAVIVGNVTAAMDRAEVTAGGESTLGRLIADAQLASSQAAGDEGVVAFMNPGGIRGNLDAGDVTHGEAFGVQPFSNIVTTMTLTGA